MPGFNALGLVALGMSGVITASSGTAPGATMSGAGTMSAGAATGSASASGATMSGAGVLSGGAASGTSNGDANASGATMSGAGLISPGSAKGSASVVGAAMNGVGAISAGAASGGTSNPQTGGGAITVPASRTAVFAAPKRVAVFNGSSPVSLAKVQADQLYYVGDFTKDLTDGATTATSVAPVSAGVTVLEGPTLQGSLGIVKLGGLDTSPGAQNFLTFRVTCANGEVFDRTILFTALDDRSQSFGKDPDDRRFYAFDISADLALSGGATVASVQAPVVNGMTSLSEPTAQGGKIILLLGSLDISNGAINSCALTITLASTEVIRRTAYFSRQDH